MVWPLGAQSARPGNARTASINGWIFGHAPTNCSPAQNSRGLSLGSSIVQHCAQNWRWLCQGRENVFSFTTCSKDRLAKATLFATDRYLRLLSRFLPLWFQVSRQPLNSERVADTSSIAARICSISPRSLMLLL